mgnify:FL=1|jgi:hypothetical protein
MIKLYKSLRINNEGFHRFGIIFGFLFLPLPCVFIYDYVIGVWNIRDLNFLDYYYVVYYQSWLDMFQAQLFEGRSNLYILRRLVIVLFSFLIGYFIVKIFAWLYEGFKR